jgi:chromosome segregation ATPase
MSDNLISDLAFVICVNGDVHPQAIASLAQSARDEITRLRARVKELGERCSGTRARAERAEAELVHTKNCHEDTAKKLHGYIHAFAAITERNAKLVKLLKDIYDFGYDMTEHKRTKAILIECGMEIPE